MDAIELMPTLAITRLGKYFRTTVPREVRKLLGLRENDEIVWIFENGKIIIKKKGEKRDIRCPFCGYETDVSAFKLLREPWRFRFYTVRMLECPKCHKVFNYYFGVSPRGKRSEYVIKIRPRSMR